MLGLEMLSTKTKAHQSLHGAIGWETMEDECSGRKNMNELKNLTRDDKDQ